MSRSNVIIDLQKTAKHGDFTVLAEIYRSRYPADGGVSPSYVRRIVKRQVTPGEGTKAKAVLDIALEYLRGKERLIERLSTAA